MLELKNYFQRGNYKMKSFIFEKEKLKRIDGLNFEILRSEEYV